ncbi:MAG TPA: pentapeptide repeat-containing protein [Nitrosopumilaceae archaeon]|nr:pentapeptide repeat-containing protein [Nitrosopumilaceae archaeon]
MKAIFLFSLLSLVLITIPTFAEELAATGDCNAKPQRGVNWYNCDKSNLDLRSKDLSESHFENTNFSQTDLSGAILKDSDFIGTNFEGANLTNADLSHTTLINVNFKKANLEGLILDDAQLFNLDFSIIKLPIEVLMKLNSFPGAKLQGMNFQGWDLSGKTIMEADLRNSNLSNGTFVETFFNNANLQNANLSSSNLKHSYFRGANLQGANLTLANLQQADMENTNLENALLSFTNLEESNLMGANLKNANLYQANLSGANLQHAVLTGTNLKFSDLSNSNLRGTKLKEADLTGTILKEINYPPKLQLSLGMPISEINCKQGFRFVEKASDGSPSCINPFSVKRLVEFGWADSTTPIPNIKNYDFILDSGKLFQLTYFLDDAKLIKIRKDTSSNSLILSLDESKGGMLGIVIPREIIDATMGVQDDRFFVLIDGQEVIYNETVNKMERTLTIDFPAGTKKIEIIGTNLI